MYQGCGLAPGALLFALGQLGKFSFFHTKHMQRTLDFMVSKHWAPFNFPWSTASCILHFHQQ